MSACHASFDSCTGSLDRWYGYDNRFTLTPTADAAGDAMTPSTRRGVFKLSPLASLLCSIAAVSAALCGSAASQTATDFYTGRTITIVCGFAAGGGYDAYARLLSRHLGR